MQKGFVTILILSVIIAIFAISNSAVVTIDFIFTEVLLSQAIVIFVCVLLGAIIATIFGWIRQMALQKEIKQLKKDKQALQVEVDGLKIQTDEQVEEQVAPDELVESDEVIE